MPAVLAALTLGVLVSVAPPAMAEKADRTKPMVVEADKPGTVDMQRQLVVFSGNVLIVQGTLQIRADRVEIREVRDARRSATATSAAPQQVQFRQKRDVPDEFVEGSADRIDFDGRADTLRLSGNAVVRRLRGTQLVDEITGHVITWENTTEVFNVEAAAAPGSRVRAVLSPRAEPPASAASAPQPAGPAHERARR